MLLFYNFLSISINNKRHEVGVLRAIGARGSDVFKIFYSEALIISIINFVLSSITLIVGSIILNNTLKENLFHLKLLSPGIIEILILLAFSLFAAFISSFLPVFKIARQQPIDAIREK